MVEADKSGALKQEVAANGDVFGDPQEEGGAIGTEDPRTMGLGEVNSQEAKDFKSRPLDKGYRSFPEGGNTGFGGGRAPTIKLDSVLRNFDGSQSVDEWLTKFMLVARYSRWEDEETRVAMLVLRLEGSALLVFEQMPQHLQFNFEAIVAKLKAAFLPSTAEAHRELMGRRYITGESPERLWSDLVRLFKLSTGQNYIDEYTLFTTIKPFFLNAIPKQAALQVKLASPTDLEDFMEKTRFVLAELAPTGVLGAVGAARRVGKPNRKPGCFRCGSTDHRVAECSRPVTCFKCKKVGHTSKDCKEQTAVIGAVAPVTQPYPLIAVTLGSSDQRRSKQVVAAVDTMACVSLIEYKVAQSLGGLIKKADESVQTVVGSEVPVIGVVSLSISLSGSTWTELEFLVVDKMPLCPVLLGLTAHPKLGRNIIVDCETGIPSYTGDPIVAAVSPADTLVIDNRDFTAWRKPVEQGFRWSFAWKWQAEQPKDIKDVPVRYEKSWFTEDTEAHFDAEVEKWIQEGILVEDDNKEEEGMRLAWNLVSQPHKPSTPVRLALDFRTLNKFLRCETQESLNEVCSDELRRWRRCPGGDLLDISRAYLQVRLVNELQMYQRAVYKGKVYKATRLMFGINIGCKVLHVILKEVLKEFLTAEQIGIYRDDILVFDQPQREEIREKVKEVLRLNGFHLKPHTSLAEGVDLLGLHVRNDNGTLRWERKECIEEKVEEIRGISTLRQVSSWIATLVAKYPVQGFLRVYGSLIQSTVGKQVAVAKCDWDAPITADLETLIAECATLLREKGDPCKGVWQIDYNAPMHLYTDASLQFEAAVLLSNGHVVEDWATAIEESIHGNYHELEALRKGLELWYAHMRVMPNANRKLFIHTDSTTVVNWVNTMMNDRHFKTNKSLFGIAISNRLKGVQMLLRDGYADASIQHVPGEENLADALTRRAKRVRIVAALQWCGWELSKQVLRAPPAVDESEYEVFIAAIHNEMGHSGVESSLASIRAVFDIADWSKFVGVYKRYHVQCAVCNVKSSKPFAYESGGVVTRARSFNEELFIDFLHLGSEQLDPVRGVVVLLDAHSRFVRIFPTVTDKPSGKDVANAIASWIADFGSPQAIRVDQGRENYNALVYDLCAKYGTQVRYGPSGHPQAQSLVERFNGTLLKLLRTLSQAEEPMATRLERARYIYLRRIQKGIGCSPIAMLSETVLADSPVESDLQRRVPSCPLSEGDKVLYKRTNHPKDEFGWLEDEVVEVLGSRTVRLRSGKVSSLDRLRKL